MVSGGHTRESRNRAVGVGYVDLVGYGRAFIANPDLVKRFRMGAKLNGVAKNGDLYGSHPKRGYTNFPFLEEVEESGRMGASGVGPSPRARL